ncbi:aspartate carbamoyltransferase catalytic subunit [Algisphaera agarilytica]|uniref:Aspartate carbamoyltransferase n=1 Tax=Algisphaera agarilytica TaxID=1385975 RepID=A0A7X0H7Z5_9BACT|nr:aspartate carbamoyltransferase catalytic subunit [Algisphaera agarilytica]MBB6430931.1 aspartate carbamoyltransferase catalytic subunit [Algisphaera agarilytica]
MSDYAWPHRHLLGIEELSAEDIRFVLQTARGLEDVSTRSVKKVPALRGKVVANLFFEDSTRTSSSFQLAAQRLSADVLDFKGKGSSVSKGETLVDTAKTIEAMGVDVMVCRHHHSGAAHKLAANVGAHVVNAGDGQHEHPTQALLDLYTIAKRLDRLDTFDFTGLTVAIVGDIAHSRVARSNVLGLQKLGAKVILVGPTTLLPGAFRDLGCELSNDLDNVLPRVDVVNMLRVQFERIASQAFPSTREYAVLYGLTPERLARCKPEVVVMHPGPMNRGLEIDGEVADGPNSAILQQVTHGLAVRMAVLFLVSTTHQN